LIILRPAEGRELISEAVANVTAIFYSSSLSIQMWGKYFMAIPRFVWNSLLAAISLGLAWGGREQLATIISNFLSLLGYWTICFGTILAIEHFWFRPRLGGYDYESWQDQSRMPLGLAGCVSLIFGIGVSFLGMAQTCRTLLVFLSDDKVASKYSC
jgi:purine-cytosine permease-like protein